MSNTFYIITYDNAYQQYFDNPKDLLAVIWWQQPKDGQVPTYDGGYFKILDNSRLLPLQNKKYNPICLPEPDTLNEAVRSKTKYDGRYTVATTAGWGVRFAQTADVPDKSTCLTTPVGDSKFTSCRSRDGDTTNRRQRFCFEIPGTVKTFSNGPRSFPAGKFTTTARDRRCANRFWNQAKEAAKRKEAEGVPNLWEKILNKVHRIRIVDRNNPGAEDKVCYNVRKTDAGRYGVCQTTHAWGICSQSCVMSDIDYNDRLLKKNPYDEQDVKVYVADLGGNEYLTAQGQYYGK